MSSKNGTRAVTAALITASVLGTGIALAPTAGAAVSSTMSTNAYKFANSQRGAAYAHHAPTTGPHQYDCSGLLWKSYAHAGKSWTRKSADQQRKTQTVDITVNQRRVGDPIFFRPNGSSTYTHVGIYAGNGYMIDAQTSTYYGPGVIKEKINNGYWNKNYVIDYRRIK